MCIYVRFTVMAYTDIWYVMVCMYVVLVRRYKCVLPVLASVDGSSSKVSISAALMSAIQ